MYEIKVLSSDDFDKIARSDSRYSYVDDSNMGFSDRQKGVAYVRDSNIHDLNKYLINHELEELIEDHSPHEDANGIRHKKFFKEFILPSLTGGIYSGGQVGGVYNAEASKENKFQPVGFLGNAGGTTSSLMNNESIFGGVSPDQRAAKQQDAQTQQQNQYDSMLNGLGSIFSNFGSQDRSGTGKSLSGSESYSGGIQPPSITNNSGSGEFSPELLAKLKSGNYSGRYSF